MQRTYAKKQRNSKNTFMCTASPKSLNSSMKEQVEVSTNNNKRLFRINITPDIVII
jgi:hypothetical protein